MGRQDISIALTPKQKQILDLEKKYYSKLNDVVFSNEFIDDLLLIEKEIRENYQELADLWDLKNKLKVSAERLVRHYIYTKWHDIIQTVYPSPVSSDLGIKTADAVICVDVKTIDIIGNGNDLNYTQTEKNQNSFYNKNNPGFEYKCNLKSIDHYSDRPVLTYVVTIAYADDNYSFKLSRGQKPTLVTTCIPNGELSNIFDFNIIENFKTYEYYDESDGHYYKRFKVTPTFSDKASRKAYLDDEFVNKRGFVDVSVLSGRSPRIAYYDPIKHCQWWYVDGRVNKEVCVLKSGSSVRYSNDILEHRFDSSGHPWCGYTKKTVTKVLP